MFFIRFCIVNHLLYCAVRFCVPVCFTACFTCFIRLCDFQCVSLDGATANCPSVRLSVGHTAASLWFLEAKFCSRESKDSLRQSALKIGAPCQKRKYDQYSDTVRHKMQVWSLYYSLTGCRIAYTGFRLVPKWVALNDLKRRNDRRRALSLR